ncbi:hypothetical protein G6F22_019625 [Rhizopus arrhizus]|nr:hypothetical protein G6F22_019625 [Rhizopus arrhizus]
MAWHARSWRSRSPRPREGVGAGAGGIHPPGAAHHLRRARRATGVDAALPAGAGNGHPAALGHPGRTRSTHVQQGIARGSGHGGRPGLRPQDAHDRPTLTPPRKRCHAHGAGTRRRQRRQNPLQLDLGPRRR